MRFRFNKNKSQPEKITKYSIRKFHFGAASVAVASLLFFGNGSVQASTTDNGVLPATENQTATGSGSNSSGGGGKSSGDSGTAGTPDASSATTAAAQVTPTPTATTVPHSTTPAEGEASSATSENLKVGENEAFSKSGGDKSNSNSTNKEEKVTKEEANEKADVTALQKKFKELKDKLSKLTDENVKERFAALVTATEKVAEDHEVTQDKANQQLGLVENAIKDVEDAIEKEAEKQENTPKPLPTYTNGTENYALAEEMRNIFTYMKANGADADKVAAIKANYDKLNEKLGLADKDAVLSEEDFNTARSNLTAARNAIEKFLEDKAVVPGEVPGTVRSEEVRPGELRRGRRSIRSVGQDRDGSNDYKNSREYYFEDGKKGVSPYDRYTYVFYTSRQSGVAWDGVRRSVEEGRDFIYADVTPTSNGFKWDIYINRARHDLSDTVGWFTLPKGVNVVGNSVTISWSNSEGNRAISPNDGRIETALSQAGLLMVTKGTTKDTGIDKRNSGYSKSWLTNDLKRLATQGGVNGNNPYKFDLLNNDSDGRALQDAKINAIYNNNGDLYYFQQGADRTAYHLSFETTGITKKRDLIYAAGMKGERVDNTAQPPVRVRFIANQWSAKTALEKTDADEYSPTITYPAYIVKQGEYKNQKYGPVSDWERHPERTDHLLNYGDISYGKSDFDANNYYHFEARNGKSSEDILLDANKRGFNDNFRMYRPDGTEITKNEMGMTGADKPGDFEYTWKWVYKDGSKASEHVRFIVVPKEPKLVTNLTNEAGKKNVKIKASGGTPGFKMELYHKVGVVLTKVAEADPNANGEATFVLLDKNNNPRALEVGEYVAKTVADLNKDYRDYAGIIHRQEEGLRSGESNVMTATDGVPPVVRMIGSTESLPESRPGDNDPAVYSVTQGDRFIPMLEAFDNTGKMTKFEITNLPNGVTATNLNAKFPIGNNYTEINTFGPATFTGNVPSNQNPGTYTSEIKVSDGVTGDKTYYFKYKVLPVAPTVNNTTTENRVLSTDKTLTGRGIAGAKITVKVKDQVLKETTVKQDGTWEVRLDRGLNSNNASHVGQLVDADSVKVIQTVSNAESRETNVTVAVGESKIQPSVAGENSVYAGAKKIVASVPHDTGIFYVKYTDKTTNTEKEIAFKRDDINGNWTSNHEDYAVITGTPIKDNFVENVTFEMKESVKEGTAVKVIANIKERGYSSPTGWKETPVTNEKPTLVANYTGNKQVVEFGSALDPKTLVRVSDKEDDKQLTRGNGTQVEVISVNGNTAVKTVNTNETGTYTVKLKATDSQGKQSDEITVTAEVTKNHQAVAKPIINLIQGESLSDAADKRSLIELTKGNGKEALPSDAKVEVTLATDSPGDKTAIAKVTFKDGTVRNVDVRYKVHKTFETVTKVYDFAGEGRNDSLLSYYLNPGGLTPGMSWVIKKANETEFKDANTKLIDMLNADVVRAGTTAYNFGAKYSVGRFTDSPSEAERLSYTPTFTHEVFDVTANTTRVVVNHGTSLTASQAQAAVSKTNNSANLPAGTTYEWVKSATDATALTDAEKNVTEYGEITRYVKVTLPKVSETGPNANQVQKYKIIPVTLKVNETVKPVVKLVGDDGQDITLTEGTADANLSKVTVYRGERANVTIKASDNTGKILELRGNGMPNGIWFNKNPNANSEVWLSSDTATETNPLSHTITGVVEIGNRIEEKIVTIRATDKTDPANVTTVKFKMVVKEQKEKYTPTAPTNAVNFNNLGTSVTSAEDVRKITDLVNVPNLSAEATNAGGVTKTLKNNGEITTENGKKVVTVTVTYPDHSTDEVTVPVAQNYNVVARPTINFKRGEALTDEDKRSLVQLQDGENKVDIPRDARVTFENLNTSMPENSGKTVTKNATATITFADSTVRTVNVNYNVLNTFPIANTIYDFKDVTRSSGHSDYYKNTGNNIPDGMSWVYKRSGGAEQGGTTFTTTLASDPVGTTSYEFIGKYNYGRFTNSPSEAEKLVHKETLVHKVFDITDSNGVTVNKGATLTADQARAAVKKADGSVPLPEGTTYEWVESTDTSTPGKRTYKVRVTLPVSQTETGNDTLPRATQEKPFKTINVTVKVKPTAPTIAPQTNGDVTITPANETNVNTLNFTYIHPNNSTQNITATKTGNTWSLTNAPADGVTINENTGVVTIKDRAVKDNQAVTAKSVTAETVATDRVESDTTNAISPAGDTERPKFVFQPDANPNTGEKVIEDGKQIVYVTPTESTDITVGNVTDNSGKLLEVKMNDSNLGLGEVRVTGEVSRRDNTEINAPKDITISGTVSKLNGNNPWRNGDVLTRYVNAKDAATNDLQGTQANPNEIKFKILTQAEKYTPTVGTQLLNKDVTAQGAKVTENEFTPIKNAITFTAERGTLKISNAANNRTTGLDIALKDEGTIKHDDTGYYVEATVTYPDGTSEVVRVNVDKSDKEAPKVKLHGVELKENSAENPKFIVFRGAKFDPTFEVTDNANPITSLSATGLPTGTFSKTGSMTSGTGVQITENNIVPTGDTLTLGEHEGSVTVKDTSNNEKTYRFKYIVADVEVKNTPETVALGTKLVDTANSGNGKDAHNYVKAVIESNTDGNDKYYAPNMSFKWSKNDSIVSTTTTFNTPGIVKYKAVADFYGPGGIYTKTVDGVGNNIKIYAPDKIEREVTFKVQPTAPTISQWQNGNLKVTPTADHDKVTIPLRDGSVTLVKKATGWEVETPKDGVIVRNGLVEVSKDLLGTTITATGTTGTGDLAVDSENAPSYTLLSHAVNKADIIKKPTDTIAATDLSGATGVTGVTDNNVPKTYANAGITSVGFANGNPTLTPDSVQNVPVTITYNDGSKENVDVTLKVAPAAPNVTVNAQNNKTGDVTLTIKRHDNSNYPDDSVVTVPGIDGTFKVKDGTITIKNDQLKDTVQTGKVTVTEGTKLPAETSDDKNIPAKLVESTEPRVTKEGQDGKTGEVTYKVTTPTGDNYPEGSKVTINGKEYDVDGEGKVKVPNNDLPDAKIPASPTKAQETGKLPKDGNTVEVPAKLTNSKGEPLNQKDLPELEKITTVWKDEQGNVLKPAITATPKDMKINLSSFEHGEIEGYVFVETKVEGSIVTHIFRKVSSNGTREDNKPEEDTPQPIPVVPSDNTERKPEAVTPDEQPAETENTTTKPKASQNILPNTGTAKGIGIFSAAVASILAGLGLIIPVKKEDKEEEEA